MAKKAKKDISGEILVDIYPHKTIITGRVDGLELKTSIGWKRIGLHTIDTMVDSFRIKMTVREKLGIWIYSSLFDPGDIGAYMHDRAKLEKLKIINYPVTKIYA